MVTFDARDPGTDPRAWDALVARLPSTDTGDATHVVVVAPHPDDESLGAGGLLASLARRSARVDVVVVTDGAASHPGAPGDLADVRAQEVRDAVALLCPRATLTLLGMPDGGTSDRRSDVTRRLHDIVGDGARTLLVAPWRGDGHRDHRVVGEVCAEVAERTGARLWEYPVWMWHWATPDSPSLPTAAMRAYPLRDREVVLKTRAIRTHASQVFDADGPPVLHGRFLTAFDRDIEMFIETPRRTPAAGDRPEPEDSTMPSGYFEELHGRKADPWGFATRWYEERKRAVTLSALPERDLGRVLEIGCSVGVLTEQLAARATAVVATDVSATALERCRARLEDAGLADRLALVDTSDGALPDGPFDTVVLSEVGYYLGHAELVDLVSSLPALLADGGTVLACHWRHPVQDYPLSGDAVQDVVDRHLGLPELVRHVEEDFTLTVHARDARSVARREGLV